MAAFRLLLFALALHLFFYSSFAKKKPKVKISIEAKPPDCREEDGAKSGDSLVVHYTGALENGQIFDTSKREGREPFEITLGEGRVIPGWEQGLIGVCSG
jgi:FKBP-type peptidyl-prolyl cis-trans isomerase